MSALVPAVSCGNFPGGGSVRLGIWWPVLEEECASVRQFKLLFRMTQIAIMSSDDDD